MVSAMGVVDVEDILKKTRAAEGRRRGIEKEKGGKVGSLRAEGARRNIGLGST